MRTNIVLNVARFEDFIDTQNKGVSSDLPSNPHAFNAQTN